ncbi:MAG: aminotransferase class III-fold pyridoxal phosphate-dependent enzyme [Phycisphaerae bacterium]|nr:aminotransferase class III-fold pyridoxal phosphate-dependent enzyme [Phycisphaerae bacterium]
MPTPTKEKQADSKSRALIRSANVLANRTAESSTGGVQEPVLARGAGATVTDVDGREYVDFDGCGGDLILGHADERLVVAVDKAVARGVRLPSMTEAHIRLAELIASRFASIDTLAFSTTARSACRHAVQAVKAFTKRDRVVVVGGSAHFEKLKLGDTGVELAPAGLEAVINRLANTDEFAAVFVDPITTSKGLAFVDAAFLAELRAECDKTGTLVILDETKTGVRAGIGGASSHLGFRPDLTVLGPSLAGGLPMGVVGGRRDIVQSVPFGECPENEWPSLLSCAAAGVVLQAVAEPDFFKNLEQVSASLETGLRQILEDSKIPLVVSRIDSLLQVHSPEGSSDGETQAAWVRFRRAALAAGMFWPCSPRSPASVSSAHAGEHIERSLGALRQTVSNPDATP